MGVNWRKALLGEAASVREAVEVLDNTGLKMVLVTDDADQLLGVVTDGDIRRGLLAGYGLESAITEVVNRKPLVASLDTPRAEKIKLLRGSQYFCIPTVDSSGKVKGLDLLTDLVEEGQRNNTVFVMAGGFGTRLSPLTDNCPKPLLKVGEKPILESIIERFIPFGFKNFCFSLHYLPEQIREYFGDGSQWGVNIRYVHESTPLGTGGALGLLPEDSYKDPVIMINGDLLTKVDFGQFLDFHLNAKNKVTIGVREYEYKVPYGVIDHDCGTFKKIIEKPSYRHHINAGIYVLDPAVIKSIKSDEYLDMPGLLKKTTAENEQVGMFPIHEYWIDIGQRPDLEKAREEFGSRFEPKDKTL